jgi:hypothetical protein
LGVSSKLSRTHQPDGALHATSIGWIRLIKAMAVPEDGIFIEFCNPGLLGIHL